MQVKGSLIALFAALAMLLPIVVPAAAEDTGPMAEVDIETEAPEGCTLGTGALSAASADQTIHYGLCLGEELLSWVTVRNACWAIGDTFEFTVCETTTGYCPDASPAPGIVGLSHFSGGPYVDAIIAPVTIESDCTGRSDYFYQGGLRIGQTTTEACAPALGCAHEPGGFVFTVSTLQSVQWDPGTVETNPNVGGGKRIFPGKVSPTDTTDRKTLSVGAVTSTPNATVYFRAFDVDDPSSDTGPVDGNGAAGNDNRGTPQAGTLSAGSAQSNEDGLATVDFTVTMHPGDNFKVVASCNQDYLAGLTVDGTDIKDTDGATLPTPQAAVTEMLTVWRNFHIELDSMQPVTGNVVTGTITGTRRNNPLVLKLTDLKVDGAPIKGLDAFGAAGRYENGSISIAGLGAHAVQENGKNTVTLKAALPAGANVANRTFTLVDDDNYNGGGSLNGDAGESLVASPAMLSLIDPTDPAKNIFGAAYLRPVYDGGGDPTNNTADNQFVLNADDSVFFRQTAPVSAGQPGRNSHVNESDDFWVVYLQMAYQGEIRRDGDPSAEPTWGGSSLVATKPSRKAFSDTASSASTVPLGAESSLIFLEGMREKTLAGATTRTIPHEVGHQFGLMGDAPGFGIMSAVGTSEFVPAHLNVLRWRVTSPGRP